MPDRSDRRSGEDPTPAPVSEGAPRDEYECMTAEEKQIVRLSAENARLAKTLEQTEMLRRFAQRYGDEMRAMLNQEEARTGRLEADVSRLEALLAEQTARRFPIMDGPSIPWSSIAPFENQAQRNHCGQTLEHLAGRGGLSVVEALHVLLCREWYKGPESASLFNLSHREAIQRLVELTSPAGDPR